MNTNDGGLSLVIDFDPSDIDKKVEEMTREILQMGNMAEQQGRKLDSLFDGLTNGGYKIEEILKKAGISFEQLVSGNMLENLKAANLEFGKTGAELRQAAADADKFVTGMENGLQSVIEQQKAALEGIKKMPEGAEKQRLMFEFAAETTEIDKATATIENLRNFVAEVQEQAKSLPQKFAEVREEMEQMAMAGTANSDRYRELEAEAIRLKSIQKDINEEISKGVEPPKELTIGQQIAEATRELEKMRAAGQENTEMYQQVQAEAVRLKNIQQGVAEELRKATTPPKELTVAQQLSHAKDEMEKMRASGQHVSDRYRELAAEAIRLRDAQEQVNGELEMMSKPTGLETAIQALNLGTGVAAAFQGGLAILGGESENLEKSMVKLQAITAAAVGVQGVYNTVTEEGGIITTITVLQTRAKAAAEALATKNTIAATIAQGALNVVAAANPYVLLAVAFASVAGALYLYSKSAESAVNNQKDLNDAIKEGNGQTAEEIIQLESLYRTAINDKLSRDQRIDAVKELQKIYPGLFANIEQEVILNGKARDAYLAVRDAIIQSARAKAAESIITKRTEEQLNKEEDARKKLLDNARLAEKLKAFIKSGKRSITLDTGSWIDQDYTQELAKQALANIQKNNAQIINEVHDSRKKLNEENSGLFAVINQGQAAMAKATTPPPPAKGTDAYWQNEIARLEELKSKTQTGSAAWKKYGDQIKKIQEKLNPKDTGPKKEKKEHEKELAEVVSNESIIALQRRVQNWNAALERIRLDAKGNKVVDVLGMDKYGKQFKTGETVGLPEAIKRAQADRAKLEAAQREAQVRSLEEQQEYVRKQYELRDQLLDQMVDPEQVDRLFRDIKGKNYGDYLKATASGLRALVESGEGTEDTARNLGEILKKLDEWEGNKSAVEIFTERLEALKKQFSGGELIAEIDKLTKGQVREDGIARNEIEKLAKKAKEDEIKAQQDKFRQILEEQKTFQEKSEDLRKEYEAAMALATTDDQRAKVNRAFSKRGTDLFFEAMQGSEEWTKVFTDMNQVATGKLEEFKEILKQKLTEAKTIEEKIKIGEFIKKLDETISSRNFIPDFSKMIKALGDSSLSTAEKIKIAHEEIAKFQEQLRYASEVASGVSDIFTQLGWEMDSAFGDALNSIQQTIAGLQAVAEGAGQAIEGFASGNILQGVAGTVKAIGGAIKAVAAWANGDAKKERNIKRQAAALKELETAYNSLAFAAERAFGSMKYEGQRDLIRNLEQQKAAIQGMLGTESSKKKGDKEKMAGYQQQIQQINQSIASIKEGIIKDVLQTDIPDAASKVGDALVDAFGRGEDAVKSLENAAQDMIKNLLRNQLNLALQNKMKPILDSLLKSSGFNADGTGSFTGLSQQQIDDFKAQVVAAGQGMQGFLDGYKDIFGNLDPTQAQGLKGDIKAVTEKTAGGIEAQMNAMRENQVAGMEVMRNSLLQLSQIEANTRRLHNIDRNIEELNRKTKNQLAGVP